MWHEIGSGVAVAERHHERREGPEASSDAAGAWDDLRAAQDEFLALDRRPHDRPDCLLHATAAALHRFAAAARACEIAGIPGERMRAYVEPLRTLHGGSPLVRRLQTWPRGYPGDFETVEWLCEGRNRADAATVPWAIEQCAMQSPVAQQHRNKVGLQARAILSAILHSTDARIASIGCGGCRDLSLIQDYVPASRGRFVLLDADRDALAFARERLAPIAGRCEFVHGRVPRALPKLRAHGPFDLVVAGGLFDYLPDAWAIATLEGVRGLLRPGGRVFLSNIARGNPFRTWMEYLADWRLIERTAEEMTRLLDASGFEAVRVSRDSTDLALLVSASAPGTAL
jgi:extracellular factor (EF) 3-hydroxypalmitic acid methyl ester biosynthesis protein